MQITSSCQGISIETESHLNCKSKFRIDVEVTSAIRTLPFQVTTLNAHWKYAILTSVIHMENVYIPIEELVMIAELTLPEGAGPFDVLVWIGDPDPAIVLPNDKAVLIIRQPIDHVAWFAALCDEIRMQDFYAKEAILRVDLPFFPFRFVPGHPFSGVEGLFAEDILRRFLGNDYS